MQEGSNYYTTGSSDRTIRRRENQRTKANWFFWGRITNKSAVTFILLGLSESEEPAVIGLHPHQGFEIITYVIKGKAYHRDTLGTESVVAEGGTQLMQTGSVCSCRSYKRTIRSVSNLVRTTFKSGGKTYTYLFQI